MSIPVELADLRARIGEFGRRAFLVTVNEGGDAHVVSVVVRDGDDHLEVGGGRSTCANVAHRGRVTLLWPAPGDGDFSLIADAEAEVRDESTIVIRPTTAVLHKLAGAAEDLPGCVPVTPPR